eukprot:1058424-Pleurochrysis_carterae.AAC.1
MELAENQKKATPAMPEPAQMRWVQKLQRALCVHHLFSRRRRDTRRRRMFERPKRLRARGSA